jgi:ribosomal protein S18 acetylase RimI-like enzyme
VNDADGLAACITAAYERYSRLLLPDVAGGIVQDIEKHLVWVFERNGAIIGGAVISRFGDKAHLRNIAVDPAYGGQGIGSALISTAIVALRANGIHSIALATHVGMPDNVGLYTHLGWVETSRAGDKVFMSRSI